MKYICSSPNSGTVQLKPSWDLFAVFFNTVVLILSLAGFEAYGQGIDPSTPPLPINQVQYWAYQIQTINAPGAVDALAATRYDMLVVEPTRTDFSEPDEGEPWAKDFDAKAMVTRLKSSPASDGVHRKLVIAYIDIGEAESFRWYWHWPDWSASDQGQNCDTSCAGITDCGECVPETEIPNNWKDFIVGWLNMVVNVSRIWSREYQFFHDSE